MADQNIPDNAGFSGWTGKPLSATPKTSIRKDLPDPITNTKPQAPVPVDTYYAKYNEMMARAKGGKDETPAEPEKSQEAPKASDIEYKDEYAEKDPGRPMDLLKSHLASLVDEGVGLYLMRVPSDFVLSDRVFRPTAMTARNGKKICEIVYSGKVIGYGIQPEKPKYQL